MFWEIDLIYILFAVVHTCTLIILSHKGDGGKYKATYNATKAGNYSLEVKDASDGEHAVGSPFQVLVEPSQAFAPATLVWWERQVSLWYHRKPRQAFIRTGNVGLVIQAGT